MWSCSTGSPLTIEGNWVAPGVVDALVAVGRRVIRSTPRTRSVRQATRSGRRTGRRDGPRRAVARPSWCRAVDVSATRWERSCPPGSFPTSRELILVFGGIGRRESTRRAYSRAARGIADALETDASADVTDVSARAVPPFADQTRADRAGTAAFQGAPHAARGPASPTSGFRPSSSPATGTPSRVRRSYSPIAFPARPPRRSRAHTSAPYWSRVPRFIVHFVTGVGSLRERATDRSSALARRAPVAVRAHRRTHRAEGRQAAVVAVAYDRGAHRKDAFAALVYGPTATVVTWWSARTAVPIVLPDGSTTCGRIPSGGPGRARPQARDRGDPDRGTRLRPVLEDRQRGQPVPGRRSLRPLPDVHDPQSRWSCSRPDPPPVLVTPPTRRTPRGPCRGRGRSR